MKTAKGTDIFLRRCFDREHTIKIGLLICRHPFMERLGAMYLMVSVSTHDCLKLVVGRSARMPLKKSKKPNH